MTSENSCNGINNAPAYSTEEYKNFIKEYVRDCNAENKMIKDLKQIYEYLVNEKNYEYAYSTFYRLAREAGCQKKYKGRYIIQKDPDIYMNSVIKPQRYNKTLTYILDEPCYGATIAEWLNLIYDDKKDLFHFVSIKDLLICLYFYNAKNKRGIPPTKLKKIIEDCLCNLCFHYE